MSLDLLIFWLLAAIIIASSIMVVEAEEIFHSALYFGLSLVATAGLYLLLQAEYVAVIQVMIYAGGVVILILLGIMLTERSEEPVR